jgi:thioredoxin-like negative regulator of GroEL
MPTLLSPARTESAGWSVVCLCAAWCRTCDTYRPDLAQLAAREPAVRFFWVDIEDDADWVDDLDVETFPTLLVLARGEPLFFGPLPPQIGVFERMLQTLRAPDAAAMLLDAEVHEALCDLGRRLRIAGA